MVYYSASDMKKGSVHIKDFISGWQWNLISIMQDTIDCCRSGCFHLKTAKGVAIKPLPTQEEANANTHSVKRSPNVNYVPRKKRHTKVEIVNKDTLDAAVALQKVGLHPAILNMASCWQPGGGALDGRTTQEESLFRRSSLCLSLYPYDLEYAKYAGFGFVAQEYPERALLRQYTEKTGDVVDTSRTKLAFFSKDVVFFKGKESSGCQYLSNPFKLDVITVPAIKNPNCVFRDGEYRLDHDDERFALRKIRSMFRMALQNGNDAMVLGAWGCGAYHNPIKHIAELFNMVMNESEFACKFTNITFAILSKDRKDEKAKTFRSVLLSK